MAVKLATYEYTGPGRKPYHAYPWDEWTDGGDWRAVAGHDFTGKAESFRATLYRVASQRDLSVRTEIERDDEGNGKAVVFRFGAEG